MELKDPWLIPVWLVVAVAALILWPRLRAKPPADAIALARTRRLEQIPRYNVLAKRHRRLMRTATALLFLGGALAAVAASQPAASTTVPQEQSSRDIVLCLDISPSMDEPVKAALRAFDEVIKGLSGDRVSLTVFNSIGLSVFPLANDYPTLREQIVDVLANDEDYKAAVSGPPNKAPSAIGEGVATCLNQFNRLEEKRSRSLILATDNESGESSVSLPQAGVIAKKRGIRVHTLDPAPQTDVGPESQGLVDLAANTGGEHFFLADPRAAARAVTSIERQEKTELRLPPVRHLVDRPAPFAVLALVFVSAGYLVLWRVRE
jgi:hypothetical protein